jgi:hypothetical protein
MINFLRSCLAIGLISIALPVGAQERGYEQGPRYHRLHRSHPSGDYPYLSGERSYPYAYQRHVEPRSPDYGYQHPANGYAYPYSNGEHYSPYTYDYSRGYQDR